MSELAAPVTIMILKFYFDTCITASAVEEVGRPTIMSTPSVSHHLRAIDAAISGLFQRVGAHKLYRLAKHHTAKILDGHLGGFEITDAADVGIYGREVRN